MATNEHQPDAFALPEFGLDNDAGPALLLSQQQQRAAVAAALRRALDEGLLTAPATPQAPAIQKPTLVSQSFARGSRQRRNAGIVVGGLFLATAAAAAVKVVFFQAQTPAPGAVATQVVKVEARSPNATPSVEAAHEAWSSGAEVYPRPEMERAPLSASARSVAPVTNQRSLKLPEASSGSGVTEEALVQVRARDLLEQANHLRRERRFRDAVGAYLEVEAAYPGTLQAQAARIAAAELLLTQLNDIKSAQQLYSRALRSGGALAAEAAFGLTEVYRRRGETEKAETALRDFVQRYPQSPLAELAQRRLKERPAANKP